MGHVRRLVLDTLKPHEPNIIQLAEELADLVGVSAVNINIVEIDRRVESAKITIEGDAIEYQQVHDLIVGLGGAIHSIDEVVAGNKIIGPSLTMQDGR